MGLTILAFMLVAESLGVDLSWRSWVVIVPPVTLLQLVPISLAGWGCANSELSSSLDTESRPRRRCRVGPGNFTASTHLSHPYESAPVSPNAGCAAIASTQASAFGEPF
jgi:hypothetical protein